MGFIMLLGCNDNIMIWSTDMGMFHLVYYISLGEPSIEYSLDMARKYLEHGAKAIQFDLPSRHPYRETDFIKGRMANAYKRYDGDYDTFLNAITCFRTDHPDFELQMVSYEDVLLCIGSRKYIDFCLKNNIKTVRLAGEGIIEQARDDFNSAGIDTLTFIDFDMKNADIDTARRTKRAVMLRNVRTGMSPRDRMVSWKDRIDFLRREGISAPIYATAGIRTGKDIVEARDSGAEGAFVGSSLMTLWGNDVKTFELLDEFEKASK